MKLVCEEYYGGCPQCGEAEWMNVGKTHWCYCPHHRVRWSPGENLLSSWRDETEEDWSRNRAALAQFRVVEPLEMGEAIPMASDAERTVADLFKRLGSSA